MLYWWANAIHTALQVHAKKRLEMDTVLCAAHIASNGGRVSHKLSDLSQSAQYQC